MTKIVGTIYQTLKKVVSEKRWPENYPKNNGKENYPRQW